MNSTPDWFWHELECISNRLIPQNSIQSTSMSWCLFAKQNWLSLKRPSVLDWRKKVRGPPRLVANSFSHRFLSILQPPMMGAFCWGLFFEGSANSNPLWPSPGIMSLKCLYFFFLAVWWVGIRSLSLKVFSSLLCIVEFSCGLNLLCWYSSTRSDVWLFHRYSLYNFN